MIEEKTQPLDAFMKRRFGFWARLSIARKLLIALGTLFILALLIAVTSLWGINRVQSAYEYSLETGVKIQDLSQELKLALAAARQAEIDFFFNLDTLGYDRAYETYALAHQGHVQRVREVVAEFSALSPRLEQTESQTRGYYKARYDANLVSISTFIDVYEQDFIQAVELSKERQAPETGLIQNLQFRAYDIKGWLYAHPEVVEMRITWLELQVAEKDFLTGEYLEDVKRINENIEVLRSQIISSQVLSSQDKSTITAMIDDYETVFRNLVENRQIFLYISAAFSLNAERINRYVEDISQVGVELADENVVQAQNSSFQTVLLLAIALIIFLIVFIVISTILSRQITRPINQLTEFTQQVEKGNMEGRAPISTGDEIGTLALSFNNMTDQLKSMLTGLEERVSERTLEIEAATLQSQRRATQFEAIAQVARAISASQDLETLLPKITNMISQHFGYYHVGVFLVDEAGEFAVLRAANSPGGKKMLDRNHQLPLGETSIVGYSTSRGKPRIALDTGSDAVYFDNPDLPETRSEMSLPMIVGDEVIGALDVQSVAPNAFSRDDVETLSTLADQVGIAIRNAQLFESTSAALSQSQLLAQQMTSSGWKQFMRSQNLSGIRRSKAKEILLKEPIVTDQLNGKDTLTIPIMLRGHKIGELKVQAADDHKWTQDEIDIATAIIERAAIALENARLLTDAQRRASREQVIGEISSTVSSSTDLEAILRNAVQELGRRMGGAEVILELGGDLVEKDNVE